jgi:hypothetical protein
LLKWGDKRWRAEPICQIRIWVKKCWLCAWLGVRTLNLRKEHKVQTSWATIQILHMIGTSGS